MPSLPDIDPNARGGGAYSQFQASLKADLQKRLQSTVKQRAGPSFDERVGKAVKEMSKKAQAVEVEQRKNLQAAVERARSRPCASAARPQANNPQQQKMLEARMSAMREQEKAYKEELEQLRDKMDNRKPLFNLADVEQGMEMLRQKQELRKQELAREEKERWQHLRSVARKAQSRPLLIEDPTYRPPKTMSTPELRLPELDPQSPDPHQRLKAAMESTWFKKTKWSKELEKLKEKTDNRQKLSEISYPPKCLMPHTRSMLAFNLAATVHPVSH
eukprot:gb/GFBE01063380.1/.p1 GENE.gb/GFBE01063380.1/~~gb/GFBE01063380.1/.p1  ORF type:complete len:274 (+),score=67.76 gb/GFBE01063380.1/:1-822(+)